MRYFLLFYCKIWQKIRVFFLLSNLIANYALVLNTLERQALVILRMA